MTDELVCWKCGASLRELPLPLGRRAECLQCRTEQHVCRMCRFYDTGVAKHCREPIAEEVKDKERANFCDYFQPLANAWRPPDERAARSAQAELEALFGGATAPQREPDAAREQLDRLFGNNKKDS